MITPADIQPTDGECTKTLDVEGLVPHEMIEMLINSIFAFTLTLIIRTNIPLPSAESVAGLVPFPGENIIANGTNFVFIFMMLMVFYILFFEIMKNTRVNDWVVVYVSFVFILSILFIPLSTLLWAITNMPDHYALIFHTNILIAGLLMVFLWRHISKDPVLCVPGTDPARVRNLSLRLLLFPVTAVTGLFLNSWDPMFRAIPFAFLYIFPVALFVYLSRDHTVVVPPQPAET